MDMEYDQYYSKLIKIWCGGNPSHYLAVRYNPTGQFTCLSCQRTYKDDKVKVDPNIGSSTTTATATNKAKKSKRKKHQSLQEAGAPQQHKERYDKHDREHRVRGGGRGSV